MMRVHVGDTLIEISGDLVAQAVMQSLPKWLTGERPPNGMREGVMKSSIKGLVPSALAAMHAEIVKKRLPIPAPDLKCKAAKQNVIAYAVSYLLSNAAVLAEGMEFIVEGEERDGAIIVSGLTAAPAALESSPASGDPSTAIPVGAH